MNQLTAVVGPIRFRFERVEHDVAPPVEAGPLLRLSDGTEVATVSREGEHYLCIDHRRDANRLSRVEFWECLDRPESPISGLLVIADAAFGRVV